VFLRAAHIYGSYKTAQAHVRLTMKSKEAREDYFQEVHNANSDRMLNLCLDMRGFFIKAGQFLSTRQDFMPEVYCRKLSTLCDKVPPDNERAQQTLEYELTRCCSLADLRNETIPGFCRRRPDLSSRPPRSLENGDRPEEWERVSWKEVFSSVDFKSPLGSASLAQVYSGVLKSGEHVAIKLQNPGVDTLMKQDLECLGAISKFLTKTGEIQFDLASPVQELKIQLVRELDFRREANIMTMEAERMKDVKWLEIPRRVPGLVTDKLVTMTKLEGTPLSDLMDPDKAGSDGDYRRLAEDTRARRIFGYQIVRKITEIWGRMVMEDGFFHADPHPGNIMLLPKTSRFSWLPFVPKTTGFNLGILDWGQVKQIDDSFRRNMSHVFESLSSQNQEAITKAFLNLGIKVENESDLESITTIARTMFDTKAYEGDCNNIFDDDCALNKNAVERVPRDIFFILRTIQIIRGLGFRMGVEDFSLASEWAGRYRESRSGATPTFSYSALD